MSNIKDVYTTFTIKMNIKSPIFIGSGDELNKTRYYFNPSTKDVKIVDDKKLRAFLAKHSLFENFQEYLMKNGDYGNLVAWLGENRINIDSVDIWKYSIKAKNIKPKDVKRNKTVQLNNIKTFVKNSNGCPYVPGSSIKGAIRTALLYLELMENRAKYSGYWKRVAYLNNGRDIKRELEKIIKELEKEVFGSIQENLFKALRVSDSSEVDISNLFVGQRADFPIHKSTVSRMPVCYEFMAEDTELCFSLEIDESLNVGGFFTKERIEKALCEFAKFQNRLYTAFQAKDVPDIYMPNEIDEKEEPNLCIGGASGFWSKTVVYALADDYQSAVCVLRQLFSSQFDRGSKGHKHAELDKKVSPHAMKLIESDGDFIPIGWTRIELV